MIRASFVPVVLRAAIHLILRQASKLRPGVHRRAPSFQAGARSQQSFRALRSHVAKRSALRRPAASLRLAVVAQGFAGGKPLQAHLNGVVFSARPEPLGLEVRSDDTHVSNSKTALDGAVNLNHHCVRSWRASFEVRSTLSSSQGSSCTSLSLTVVRKSLAR